MKKGVIIFAVLLIVVILILVVYFSSKNPLENCEKISEPVAMIQCYTEIALEKADLSVCEQVQDKEFVSVCYGAIANDCSCLSSVRELYPDTCNLIKEMGVRGACEDYTEETISEMISVCNGAANKRIMLDCYFSIIFKTQDLSICEKIINDTFVNECKQEITTLCTLSSNKREYSLLCD